MSGKNETNSSRSDSIWSALILGVPLSVGVIVFLQQPQFEGTLAQRYIEHPVEKAEIVLFCCAIAALVSRCWGLFGQRRAMRHEILPAWDGRPQVPAEANALVDRLAGLPRSVQHSWIGRRCRTVLDFLCRRDSAAGLDDHMRISADNDAMTLDAGYSFIRLVTWAIPMLGFLGTVLGITDAIAGVSPEQLENDLSSVTGGLATAFDTTGLALLLTMVLMLIAFVIQRLEERTFQGIDEYLDRELFHRFARPGNDHGPMVEAMEQLVRRQAEVWAASLAEMERHSHAVAVEQQDRLTHALTQAIEFSLTAHQVHLAEMRKAAQEQTVQVLQPLTGLAAAMKQQHLALKPIARAMHQMGETLGKLQENEQHLLRLQKLLHQNLQALSAAGSFEEAVQSLTAAIHLLSARGGIAGSLRLIGGADEKKAA